MPIAEHQACEWRHCHQRYQHYVELRDPKRPESIYVCGGHLDVATTWMHLQQADRHLSGDLVVHTDLLSW